jgi:hypothetical protein
MNGKARREGEEEWEENHEEWGDDEVWDPTETNRPLSVRPRSVWEAIYRYRCGLRQSQWPR